LAKRYEYRIFVGKPDGKKPLGRTRHRWEDNIRIDVDQRRALMNAIMNVQFPQNAAQLAASQEVC
jgi:hypothetical protein